MRGEAVVIHGASGGVGSLALQFAKMRGRVAYPNGVEPEPRKRPGITFMSYDGTPGVREFERLGKAVEAAKLNVAIAASFRLRAVTFSHF